MKLANNRNKLEMSDVKISRQKLFFNMLNSFKVCISFFNWLIYIFLVVLGLCCCVTAFSMCGEWGLLLWGTGSQFSVCMALGLESPGSAVVTHKPRCSAACGSSRPGIEPLSPASVGRFLTTGPPGNSKNYYFLIN